MDIKEYKDNLITELAMFTLRNNGSYNDPRHYVKLPAPLNPNSPKGYSFVNHTFTIPCNHYFIDNEPATCNEVVIVIGQSIVITFRGQLIRHVTYQFNTFELKRKGDTLALLGHYHNTIITT